jgi:hypothetical protein
LGVGALPFGQGFQRPFRTRGGSGRDPRTLSLANFRGPSGANARAGIPKAALIAWACSGLRPPAQGKEMSGVRGQANSECGIDTAVSGLPRAVSVGDGSRVRSPHLSQVLVMAVAGSVAGCSG